MDVAARTLTGKFVVLEPIDTHHRAKLAPLAAEPSIWKHTALGPSFDVYFDTLLGLRDSGAQIPFAVRLLATGDYVGGTRFLDIHPEHRRLEIGGTWYHPSAWGTAVNPEAKLLLLAHAFDGAEANRVQLLTDVLNERSQAAIAKLGAVREGVVRSHMLMGGTRRRDSVMFSIVREEWPQVHETLTTRLATFSAPTR